MTDQGQDAEFDIVPTWTAEVALDLGADFHVVAGCRGSGTPSVLDWFVEYLASDTEGPALDIGAGVGGPAAYLAHATSLRPVLLEPAMGACRAAVRLFGLPTVQSDAAALPVADASVAVAWSLGVLCTMDDQEQLLREARRVLRPQGTFGLLVFVATRPDLPDQPSGNHFPQDGELADLLASAGFEIRRSTSVPDLPEAPPDWSRRADRIEDELSRRYGSEPAWQTAAEQERRIGALIKDGDVVGRLLIVTPSSRPSD